MNQLIFRSFKANGFWLECPPSPAAAMHCGYLFSWPAVDLRRPQLRRAPCSRTPARQSARSAAAARARFLQLLAGKSKDRSLDPLPNALEINEYT